MIWYVSRNYKNKTSAGNKAKTDVELIMQDMGFCNAGFPQTTYKNAVLHFVMTLLDVLRTPLSLHRGDILFIQYPLKKYFSLLCNMAHMRGAKVAILIHDLGSFRRKALTIPKEMARLSHADYIIAHNERMKRWIESNGCNKPVGTLQIFDYLSSTSHQASYLPAADGLYRIVYAGSLNRRKNTFLYVAGQYAANYRYILYGNGFEPQQAANAHRFECKGFTPSDTLIATAEGDFGLVWDGNSTTECAGAWGEYLKYNNPHKTSLYIRCGLPVVVWSQSAMAPFVEKEHIGLAIGSLQQLSAALQQLTPAEYRDMRLNVEKLGRRLSTGYYFKQAATKAIEWLQHNKEDVKP